MFGRISSGEGSVEQISAAEATTILNVFTSLLKGLVPASGVSQKTGETERDYLLVMAEPARVYRPIGEITPGDKVYAMDFETGLWALRSVVNRKDSYYEGEVLTISTAECSIQTTVGHPFWVVRGKDLANRTVPALLEDGEDEGLALEGRWVNSDELLQGHILFDKTGREVVITSITCRRESRFHVCNLECHVAPKRYH